jgi:hypothetical protein
LLSAAGPKTAAFLGRYIDDLAAHTGSELLLVQRYFDSQTRKHGRAIRSTLRVTADACRARAPALAALMLAEAGIAHLRNEVFSPGDVILDARVNRDVLLLHLHAIRDEPSPVSDTRSLNASLQRLIAGDGVSMRVDRDAVMLAITVGVSLNTTF